MDIDQLLAPLQPLSDYLGTENPREDLQFLLVILLVLGGLLFAFFLIRSGRRGSVKTGSLAADRSGEGFDRFASLAGKFEKLEMNSNASRTELMREIELLKSRVDYLEDTLRQASGSERGTVESFSPPPSVPGVSDLGSGPVDDDEFETPVEFSSPPPTLDVDAPFDPNDIDEDLADRETADEVAPALDPIARKSTVLLAGEDLEDAGAELGVELSGEPDAATGDAKTPLMGATEGSKDLTSGLSRTRSGIFRRIREVFSGKPSLSEEMVDELQAFLVSTDLGLKMVRTLTDDLKDGLGRGDEVTEEHLLERLQDLVKKRLMSLATEAKPILPERRVDGPCVVMMVGVNGVGKTTTTAKLAALWKAEGAKILLVAADTFRAAASEQLKRWGAELDIPVEAGVEGAKPSTVVYDAMERARTENFDVVLVDTAGRLHTKGNLMQELEGIKNVMQRHQLNAPHEIFLVIDGTTGQNALQQAKEFHNAVSLTGLVVTKLDGTSKGGIVVAVQDEYDLPVRYIGVGEAAQDLKPFEVNDYIEALFDENATAELSEPSAHGRKRRRRREEGEQAASS